MGTSKGYDCRYLCFSGEPGIKALSVHAWLDCSLLSRLPGEPSGEPSRTPASESFQPKQLSTGSCHSLVKASSQDMGAGGALLIPGHFRPSSCRGSAPQHPEKVKPEIGALSRVPTASALSQCSFLSFLHSSFYLTS